MEDEKRYQTQLEGIVTGVASSIEQFERGMRKLFDSEANENRVPVSIQFPSRVIKTSVPR